MTKHYAYFCETDENLLGVVIKFWNACIPVFSIFVVLFLRIEQNCPDFQIFIVLALSVKEAR